MNRKSLTIIAAISLSLVWLVAGCSSPNSGSDSDVDLMTRDQTLNLDDAYGGFNFGDEEPAFADAMLAADYGPEGAGLRRRSGLREVWRHARDTRALSAYLGRFPDPSTTHGQSGGNGGGA